MWPRVLFSLLVLSFMWQLSNAYNMSMLRSLRECLRHDAGLLCIKEKALEMIDEALVSNTPVQLAEYIEVAKDPDYRFNTTDYQTLAIDAKQRSLQLDTILVKRLDDFFESRTIKLHLASVFNEGRAKKGGKKGGGMLLLAGLAMAGMMAQMAMSKIAMMAGAALIIAKMALLISGIVGLKKLIGGSGGSDSHVVYATTSGGDHGGGGYGGGSYGGGGGWHRSLEQNDGFYSSADTLAYNAYVKNQENNTV